MAGKSGPVTYTVRRTLPGAVEVPSLRRKSVSVPTRVATGRGLVTPVGASAHELDDEPHLGLAEDRLYGAHESFALAN
jgi:hypothetical protein